MARSTSSSRRRMAGAVTAALLSLGLLTACGSGSSDTDSSSSSSSQKSHSGAGSSDAGAKSGSKLRSKAEGGLQPGDSLTAHNFALNIEGARVEYLKEVSGLNQEQSTQQQHQQQGTPGRKLIPGQQSGGTVTVVRGTTHSAQFTGLVNGRIQPATASIVLLDYQDSAVKQYTMQNPTVIKVDTSAGADRAETVTIRFTSLTIS
ncbi:phage tail protein [Streptomyces sp. N2-109]|uniref:Phage tail protein n=1 Tax=Streptomyces gossypii TaxID=2883101 RepID=A0ABT2JZ25_9ACTN|nr:phage tail protein [Streptomyces gossypii]MCT2592684.1 phage tail protein [Streptomyces gossypii]